jgi:heme/copper-type cytochrome/quinol oxidase subunit 2
METNNSSRKNSNTIYCPFLGCTDDKDTIVSYPSYQNCCFHAKPVKSVNLEHQKNFCLQLTFQTCSVFSTNKIEKLPKEIISQKQQKYKLRTVIWIIIVVLIVLLSTGIVIFKLIEIPKKSQNLSYLMPSTRELTIVTPQLLEIPVTSGSMPTVEITKSVIIANDVDIIKTNTSTSGEKKTSTPTPTIIPPHVLETPFGTTNKFVIHQLSDGEGFIILAQKYKTTVEAIKGINYKLPATLIIGKMIVIPINTIIITGMPSFSIYKVEESGQTVIELAKMLQVNSQELSFYNSLPDNFVFEKGDLLIIPHDKNQ